MSDPLSRGKSGVAAAPAAEGDDSTALRRVLGPIDASCVVIGAIIGVGIFFTPSRVATLAGSAPMALLAWGVGGVIALAGALTFAELGARFPHAGGQYEILRDAWGPLPAFLFVFCNATATQAGAIAIIALLCTQNLAVAVLGELPGSVASVATSALLIVLVTVANAVGVRWGSGIQNVTVAAKLLTLLLVVVLALKVAPAIGSAVEGAALLPGGALPSGEAQAMRAASPSGGSAAGTGAGLLLLLFAAIVPSFFAYGGWQHALWIAGEVRDPRRTLPLSIVGGVIVVVAAYMLANWAYLHLLGYEGVTRSGALAADAVARVWPTYGKRFTAGAVAISAFGVLNAQLLSGPRLIYRMAVDGRFFAPFARVSAGGRTPRAAIVLLGALGLALLLLAAGFSNNAIDAIDRLTTGAVFIDGIFFVLTGAALFILRGRGAAGGAAPRVRLGYPFAPALFVLGEVGIIIGAYTEGSTRSAAKIGIGWILAAAALYAVFFRNSQRNRATHCPE
ncbi:MAG: amino acid permease [Phycisphaerales bacterium]|nr:amino acid permease [Phycisphaerales bacterium]